ncbi:MAG: SMC-Scp complex subunit ScpB [Erysipelotrichaceae bacterium]
MENKVYIEGLLFIAGDEGLTLDKLASTLAIEKSEVLLEIEKLQESLLQNGSALEVVCLAGSYKLVTKAEVYQIAESIYKEEKSAPLTNAALETLAIVAYKQPITRVEIEEIRGVGCDLMLKKLVIKGLLEEAGRLDAVGKPILYQVTAEFLNLFKLASLDELPALKVNNEEEDIHLFHLVGE